MDTGWAWWSGCPGGSRGRMGGGFAGVVGTGVGRRCALGGGACWVGLVAGHKLRLVVVATGYG